MSTIKDIEWMLTQFNVDPENARLYSYYNSDNIWKTLNVQRDENRHSSFLKWLFEKEALTNGSCFEKFLNTIVHCDVDSIIDDKLKKAILLQNLKVTEISIDCEREIRTLSKIESEDRLDLFIDAAIAGVEGYDKLEIIIENKVDAKEGKPKFGKESKEADLTDPEKEYRKKKQTERYYFGCSKADCNRKGDLSRTLQIFVFLTAHNLTNNKKYVVVSYQDIVDYILEPYVVREDIDDFDKFIIRDYLKNLGNQLNKNISAMAMTNEERDLLIQFFDRNEDLFRMALEAKSQTAETEEEEKEYKKMFDSFNKTKVRRFFSINGTQNLKMYQVVSEFVKYRLGQGAKIEDIDKEISGYTKEDVCHVSSDKAKVRRQEKCYEDSFNGIPIFVTKEWGINDKGRNFSGFMDSVNKKYSKFQIAEKDRPMSDAQM